MNAQGLLDLAARCEAATGPERDLDEAIATALGWSPIPNPTYAGGLVGRWNLPDGSMSGMEGPPQFTASLDAAMSLVPVSPAYIVETQAVKRDGKVRHWARVSFIVESGWNYGDEGRGATGGLALTAAALRARAASAAGARSAETEGLGPEDARAAREAGDAQPIPSEGPSNDR